MLETGGRGKVLIAEGEDLGVEDGGSEICHFEDVASIRREGTNSTFVDDEEAGTSWDCFW
jgi:hypothetical protein